MLERTKWFIHPLMIFIFSTVAVVLSLFLYIYWYVEISTGLKAAIQKAQLDPDQILASQTWVVILVLSILVGIILLGIFIIFVYLQKTLQFFRLQNNFINNFTHELKTPVTSMKLYLETFQKYDLTREDQLRYIGYMIQDADRLSSNINRILNLAKIESKTYTGEFVTKDLVSVLEQFYIKNKHLFVGSEINIHNPSGRTLTSRIDPTLFEMLLMNLLTNAIKYNDSKTPRVDITFRPHKKSLYIHFEDNGLGLPKPEIKRIFKKFYQIGRADNMSAKGSGVGLYLVDIIARLHKGKVTAQSRGPGQGSVFSLTLPLSPVATAKREQP